MFAVIPQGDFDTLNISIPNASFERSIIVIIITIYPAVLLFAQEVYFDNRLTGEA